MKRALRLGLGAILVLVALLALFLFGPFGAPDLRPHPHPAANYTQAVARIDAVHRAEAIASLSPGAGSLALLHGARTDTAVVLYHGYTQVPAQFAVLARDYFQRGCNVWAPLMPYHGLRDRMTNDLSRLTAATLRNHADRAIDIAAGLGRQVIVVGLSAGGALVTWSAVARPEVRQAIAISPLLHPIGFPTWADRALARAFTVLPDHYEWWNATTHEREPGPAYPRYSYRGVTAFLMLGEWADAARHPAAPAEVVLVRNLADPYVDGAYNLDHFRRFAAPGRLRVVTIPAGARLAHDLVGTDGPDPARTRLAYQYLSRAVGFELPDPRGPATAPASFETTDVTEGAR